MTRMTFILWFILFGFIFMGASTTLLGSTGPRGFPKPPDTLLMTASQEAWKRTGSTIIMPIKVVLIGPILLSKNFLQDDPPPPFVGLYLIIYWTLLGTIIHEVYGRYSSRA